MELWQWHCRNRREKKIVLVCGNVIAEIGGKKICGNCGNAIATIPFPFLFFFEK